MNSILFLLRQMTDELASVAESLTAAGIRVHTEFTDGLTVFDIVSSIAETADPVLSDETLVITDSEDVSKQLTPSGCAVVGYEHDGIHLSTSEIIDFLEALTPEYCKEVFLSITGRGAVYESDTVILYPLTEEEFVTAYEHFKRAPYVLTEDQHDYRESDIRALYQNRRLLSQFRGNYGSYRAEHNGAVIGYGSVFEDTLASGQIVTTIDFLILPQFRGNHLGHELVEALLATARRDDPKLPVYALVHPNNAACIALLASCGFTLSRDLTQTDAPQGTPLTPQRRDPGCAPTPHASQGPVPLVYCHPGRR